MAPPLWWCLWDSCVGVDNTFHTIPTGGSGGKNVFFLNSGGGTYKMAGTKIYVAQKYWSYIRIYFKGCIMCYQNILSLPPHLLANIVPPGAANWRITNHRHVVCWLVLAGGPAGICRSAVVIIVSISSPIGRHYPLPLFTPILPICLPLVLVDCCVKRRRGHWLAGTLSYLFHPGRHHLFLQLIIFARYHQHHLHTHHPHHFLIDASSRPCAAAALSLQPSPSTIASRRTRVSRHVAIIVVSSFVCSRCLLIVALNAKWNPCCHQWHYCHCRVVVVTVVLVVIAALAIDWVELDNGVESSPSSAPPLPPWQQIGGQRHATEVPRLSLSMQWWLAAMTACCCGGWGAMALANCITMVDTV